MLSDDGVLESIEIIEAAVRGTWTLQRSARFTSPAFPHPPVELLAPDGRVYLPDFEFTVNVGSGGGAARVLDARAGVHPGLLKAALVAVLTAVGIHIETARPVPCVCVLGVEPLAFRKAACDSSTTFRHTSGSPKTRSSPSARTLNTSARMP